MLSKIKDGIPEREKERTLARIDALLLSPELEISEQEEEKATPATEVAKQPLLTSVVVGVSSHYALFFSCNTTIKNLHKAYLIENRHKSPELQKEYDRQFGLVCKRRRLG
ncbi:MAG: hypothetical protein AABY34_04435 [Pseudomonadota bacterium]|mgnify:FL=1